METLGSRLILSPRPRRRDRLRDGTWKLHEFFEDGGFELYHLGSDPGERRNVASLFPGETERLRERLRAWRDRVGAPMPLGPNPAFDAEAEAAAIRVLID